MAETNTRLKMLLIWLATLGLTAGLLVAGSQAAEAAPAPVLPAPATAMTADRLPTVQIDGVVWSQVVVGNTVYAGGRFANARPAGAAAGTSLTPRANLLAYDITTGNLVTSFAPTLNAQVLSVAASPDGSRIYVVGDFTTADGQARRRLAAYSTATGQLITSFNPVGVTSQARAVIATNDTVYVGGGFTAAGSSSRGNLAAFRAADGALLPWNPNADYTVWALAISSDGSSVFAGGSFQNVGGQPAYGLAKLSGSGAGALDTSWQAANTVRNAGPDAGITSLRVQNNFVYGTTYHFGPGGNLEGVFKAPVGSGVVEWVTDCHGDNYSVYLSEGVVYSVGHAHYCGNVGGGFPQYSSWKFQHSQAWTDTVGGDHLQEVHGYPNWAGVKPSPSIVHWLPDMAIGSFTGQYQAGWSITGNSDYVVVGGEFPRVNSVGQQGLVRFAKRAIAPRAEGPRVASTPYVPTIVPTSTTSARISWPAAYDRDDRALTYKVIRGGAFGTPRHTTTANSNWWTTPRLGFVETGLTPGTTYSYQIVVNDPGGNTVYGSTASVTMPTSFAAASAYASSVRGNGARIYWPMNETSGLNITDRAAGTTASTNLGVSDGRGDNGVTWNQAGAIGGDSAAALTDNDWSRVYSLGIETAPDTFSTQAWIKTTTTRGGRIFGFGDLQTGSSGHRDRHVYMTDAGRLIFGVRAQNGNLRTVASTRSYNDNQWHMVTPTMSAQGMALYVDGVRVGVRTDTTQGEAYLGAWRLGGDNLAGWPSRPNTVNFIGTVDEVAVYPIALTQNQVVAQYEASGRTPALPPAPTDTYGAAVYADDPDLYWRLGESSGTLAADSGRSMNDGTYRNGVTLGASGKVAGNSAAAFNGINGFVSSNGQFSNPTVYTQEAWFRTTTIAGGKIMGFGNNQAGNSSSYDRHVYMQNDGRLVFGVWTGQTNVITTSSPYNDGEWHHVVATQSGNGMKLYLDGILQGTNPQTGAQDYSGYWKVGGDVTWGSLSNYFNGVIDEVAVYSRELGTSRINAHYTAAGGTPNQNQDPTATFTTTQQDLRVTADAADSGDPDGTIVSYAWNFGDGGTATTKTASHTYNRAGTYAITLTVTDDDGATDTATKEVTVQAANQAPTASFTTSTSDLTVSTDGAGSNDPDGTIANYSWDFGDGGNGSGATDSHTYATAGTYTVTLTVTDDDGATDTATKPITVSAPAAVARDAFDRTVSNGWGSAEIGGAWTTSGTSSNYAVASDVGTMRIALSGSTTASLNSVSANNVEVTSAFGYDKPGTGGGVYTSFVARRIGTSDYRVKVRVTGTATTVYLTRTVNGAETVLSTQNAAGLVYAAGDVLQIRFQAQGTGTTSLRAKIWKSTTSEPTAWTLSTTDGTAALQNPGSVGVYNYLSGSATNAPVTFRAVDFEVN